MPPLAEHPDGVLLLLRAVPKSGRSELGEVRGQRLVVRVTAAPEDGRANAALIKLLAKAAGIAPSDIELTAGATSRDKTLLLRGVTVEELTERLGL